MVFGRFVNCVAPGDTCVKLCAVGDTGLKTGWVRCRHGVGGGGGVGRGGAGWGGAGWLRTSLIVSYHSTNLAPIAPKIQCVSVCGLFYSCDLQIAVRMEFAIDDLLTL